LKDGESRRCENAGVGFWEEFQAGNAIAALKATLALQARVKRDGSWATIPARELVPGDLMDGLGEVACAKWLLVGGRPNGKTQIAAQRRTNMSKAITAEKAASLINDRNHVHTRTAIVAEYLLMNAFFTRPIKGFLDRGC